MKLHFIYIALGLAAAAAEGFLAYVGWQFYKPSVVIKRKKSDSEAGSGQTHSSSGKSSQPDEIRNRYKINHPKDAYLTEYNAGKELLQNEKMQDLYLTSYDGLKLHGSFWAAENPQRIVLLSHGYKGSGFNDFANIAPYLHDNGCSLLFIDQRGHGLSEGNQSTFGAKEQKDILAWLQILTSMNTDNLPVYLYGDSMGAAAVLMTAGHPLHDSVRGVIADCGFHSMKEQLQDMIRDWYHMEKIPFLTAHIDLFCRMHAGFSMADADTTAAMKQIQIPALFFHGEEDTFVYPKHTLKNYELCNAPKQLVLIPGARHLCSAYADKALYRKSIMEFFQTYN